MTPTDIDEAVQALLSGAVILIPTDTVYGLAAAADNEAAVAAMFALKNRPVDVRVAVLVADTEQAERFVFLGKTGRALADSFWPGALTIVAARHVVGSLAAGDDETLGVRCPDDAVARALAAAVGPIAATSANLHGQDPPRTAREAAELFPEIGVVIDDGPRLQTASTVVSVVGSTVEVLREGLVSQKQIEAQLEIDS